MASASVLSTSKYNNALAPTRPHLVQILHAGNAGDHRTENDRGDNHFNELDKTVTQRFHASSGFRIEVSQADTDGNSDKNLKV